MSTPSDDFTHLKRLLALKKHEQPPPGYFSRFSDRVLAKIERQEQHAYSSWWGWFIERFDAKPVLACAYSIFVSSLLLVGFKAANAVEPQASVPWLVATGSAGPFQVLETSSFLRPAPLNNMGVVPPGVRSKQPLVWQLGHSSLEPATSSMAGF